MYESNKFFLKIFKTLTDNKHDESYYKGNRLEQLL